MVSINKQSIPSHELSGSLECPVLAGSLVKPVLPEALGTPGAPECPVSPVSNGQGLEGELEALAAECACTCAEDNGSEKVFELARGVKALEKQGGWPLETSERLCLFKKWKEASQPFLDPTKDY